MTSARGRLVRLSELELLDRKVTRDGGALRYLGGAAYGLTSSVFRSEIVPGSGPEPHVHPYAEIFVIEVGQGRFRVGSDAIDAVAGDIVIVPPGAPHNFTNSGTSNLRHTVIHDGAPRFISTPASLDDP